VAGPAPSASSFFVYQKRIAQVTREEERIRELVELVAQANGSNEVLALAEELKGLVDDRKKRLKGNPPAGPTESDVSGVGNAPTRFRRRQGEVP
jgi:hypothetical protein